ncbi:MAG: PA2778 family cysteine peptidase [Pseudomonadota bacterium]
MQAAGANCRRFLIVFSLAFLSACTSNPPQRLSTSTEGVSDRQLLTGLPFHPQIEDQCGPATLATMLAARSVSVEPQELQGRVYIPDKQGAVTTEMVAVARQFGLLVYPLEADINVIVQEINAGNPVLVLQNLGLEWAPRWHYSVIIGYDLERRTLILRSGSEPEREVGVDFFDKTWRRAQRWAVVIVSPDSLPASVEPTPFLLAASDLEQVGQTGAALDAYKAAIEYWPNLAAALFGAGNAAYNLDQYDLATDRYLQFLEQSPSTAAGWNNLAFALLKSECPRAALQAVQCATLLAPDDPNFLSSLNELRATTALEQIDSCPTLRCPEPPSY